MDVNFHLWIIPLLPLVGAALNGFVGKRLPKTVVSAIALLFPGAAFLQAIWIASRFFAIKPPYIETHGAWITAGSFTVHFGFMLDQLSFIMLLVVTGVGFLIHIYSVGYMSDDPGYYRFFSYLNLFMFFMLMLVLANNYLLMFVGWEGVGLASYLLIGFYFLKDSASQAGKKAFITNRIGDFAFLIGMFLMIQHFGSLDYLTVFRKASAFPVETGGAEVLTWIALCLMIGATGKSAQIPLYVWLPDAMEGPTPVSALIHAATMVTAGIYMVARSNVIFNHAPMALTAVAVLGALTAIFAASIGIVQTDIKRVLAYSTISQLGYMFMACGVAAYSAAIFHLMTHAFFKALLFLSAGSVIHALSGEQDMRHMGGLRKLIPVTFWVMTAGTIAIAGIWPFAGFFSKDEILWKAWSSGGAGKLFWAIGYITALMTSFYMFRLLFMTFFGERREAAHAPADAHSAHPPAAHAHGHGVHESPWIMLGPLVVLAILSLVGGWIGWPQALGGDNRFEKFLAPVFEHTQEAPAASERREVPANAAGAAAAPGREQGVEPGHAGTTEVHGEEGTEQLLTGLSLLAGLAGLGLAYFLYVARPEKPKQIAASLGGLYRTVLNKYYVDEGYYALFIDPIVNGSRAFLWKAIDVGVVDGAVNGAGHVAKYAGGRLRRMQSGNIRSYAGWVAIGAVGVLAYMIYVGVQ